MPIPSEVTLGCLSRCMCNGASWLVQDDFPASQIWADELERVLSHLEAHGQFQRYLPNLRGKLTQRNGALAEARVSFFFIRNGFSITSWEPAGDSDSVGEFELQWKSDPSIFVEVKGPTWEGQLCEDERKNGRKDTGKYMHSEIRSLDTNGKVLAAMRKAGQQGKFAKGRPNLLVVYTSYLFVSPLELNVKIVVPKLKTGLNDFPSLGGVLVFDTTCKGLTIDYNILFIENEAADCSSRLPTSVVQWFRGYARNGN